MFTQGETQISRNIQGLRNQAGLTQEQLAVHLQLKGMDISRVGLSKAETGRRHLRADELLAIKEILDVTFDDLFYAKIR